MTNGDQQRPPSFRSGRRIISEAANGIESRPGRAWLTITGIMMGIAALVAPLGLALTAAHRVTSGLDALVPSLITVTSGASSVDDELGLRWESVTPIAQLEGVISVGAAATVGDGVFAESSLAGFTDGERVRVDLIAVTPEVLEAVDGQIERGSFHPGLAKHDSPGPAVLGSSAARLLGLQSFYPGRDAVLVEGVLWPVVGILGDHDPQAGFAGSILIPATSLRATDIQPDTLYVRTDRESTSRLTAALPTLANPNHPLSVLVSTTATSSGVAVRERVASDISQFTIILGVVVGVLSAVAVSTVTLTAVAERRPEIGLRKALGATRRRIAGELLVETCLLGVVGAVIGVAAGLLVVVVSASREGWVPVVDRSHIVLGLMLGPILGIIGGFYPAMRAASIEPAQALRGL